MRPQAKIDNFAFKNSNIIVEGLYWKLKDYFSWKKFEMQKNNVFNKLNIIIAELFSLSFHANYYKIMRI